MSSWPSWWDWELELSPHLLKRMAERGFNELDLRRMLSVATSLRWDVVPGRWIARTRLRGRFWEVIVEPDDDAHRLVVITAYSVSP
jgi:hypothetical protein